MISNYQWEGKTIPYPCTFKICKTSNKWEETDGNSFFFVSFLFVLLILRMLSDFIMQGGTFFVVIVEIGAIPDEADEEEDWIELHTTGKQISLKKEEKSLIIDSDICNRACSSSTLLDHQKLGNRNRHSGIQSISQLVIQSGGDEDKWINTACKRNSKLIR